MYRLLKLPNLALLVLNCLVAFFVFRALTESPAESDTALLSSVGEEDAGSTEPRMAPLSTDRRPFSYYADSILSTGRKVFRPQVPVDEFASGDGQSAANQLLGAFRLTGVMLGEDSHQAVLVDTRSGTILFVEEGEVVDGVLLEKVDRNSATLRVGETTKKIILYEAIATDRK